MCQIHVKLPGGREYRKLLQSFKRAQDWVESEYAYVLPKDASRSQSRSYCQEISAFQSNMRAMNNQRIEPVFDINRSIKPDHRTSFDLVSPDESLKASLTYISSR